jgi:hypothetical protein
MKIIAFSGKKQSGKTTALLHVAKQLISGYVIVNFADTLKIIVARTFVPAADLPKGIEPIKWIDENKDTVLPCGMTVRAMLQTLGTDVFRALWEPVWLNAFRHRLPKEAESGKVTVLVGDVRFPNELALIHELGGKVIRLTRDPNAGNDQHASETALDNEKDFDAFIDNGALAVDQANRMVWDTIFKGEGWL